MRVDTPTGLRGARAWWRKNLKQPLKRHEWGIVIALWVVCFALGAWGLVLDALAAGRAYWMPEIVYQTLHLFTFKSIETTAGTPWQLEAARWLAPTAAIYTASKGLVSVFYDQAQVLRAGLMRRHVIICGLSDKGRLIARSFLERGDRVVVIEKEASRGKLAGSRAEGAVVIAGEADDPEVLRMAGVRHARYVIATCDDATNAEIVVQARALRRDTDGRLDCLVHVQDPGLLDSLGSLAGVLEDPDRFGVRFFNLLEMGARTLLTECPPFGLLADGAVPIAVGMNATDAFGARVLRELAMRWAIRVGPGGPALSLVTLDDATADALSEVLGSDPSLDRLVAVQALGSLASTGAISVAYVLDADPNDATERALALRASLPASTRLVVRYPRAAGLSRLLGDNDANTCGPVEAFPIYERTCSNPDLLLGAQVDEVARGLHEFYGSNVNAKAPDWDHLSETYREASRQQAEWIFRILTDSGFDIVPSAPRGSAVLEFTDDEVERLSRVEHARWCAERALDGWTYAETRDNVLKHHPDLVPWDVLPERVRDYDRKFVRFWPGLLAKPSIGFAVSRG